MVIWVIVCGRLGWSEDVELHELFLRARSCCYVDECFEDYQKDYEGYAEGTPTVEGFEFHLRLTLIWNVRLMRYVW